jgi:ABA sandwich protein
MKIASELDCEVAAKVFGWLYTATDGITNYGSPIWDEKDKYENCGDGYKRIPHYSTDISAAFLVVEKMRERGYSLTLMQLPELNWLASFYMTRTDNGTESGHATPSEAICKAALAALAAKETKL